MFQKRSAKPETVLSFTCAQMFFGGLFQLLLSFPDGEWARFDVTAVSWKSVLAVGYLVTAGSIVGLNCYLWLLTRVSAAKLEQRHEARQARNAERIDFPNTMRSTGRRSFH